MSIDSFSPAVFPRLQGEGLNVEREKERVRGYADGHAEGFRAGNAAARAAAEQAEAERAARDADDARVLADAVAALRAAARSFADRERELAAAAQHRVLGHAVELAELIVADALTDADTAAASAVRRVLATVDAPEVRELRLHPDDITALIRVGAQPDGVALSADDALERGDAVAVLEHGFIDARVSSALERARIVAAEAES